jgi:prenyltransferase beta subunit
MRLILCVSRRNDRVGKVVNATTGRGFDASALRLTKKRNHLRKNETMEHKYSTICLALAIVLLVAVGLRAEEKRGAVGAAELTPAAEKAIEHALKYLARTQKPDGSWGDGNKVAYTSLSLMAFMVKGDMPEQPPYGDKMSKGLEYLLKQSAEGRGYMGKSMYEHGFATLALSEVWGSTSRDKQVRQALKKAVDVIIRGQMAGGCWGYSPGGGGGDISVTVAQCVALASAKEAGIFVPNETIDKALKYVKSCQGKSGGFGYNGPGEGYARTAAGVTSLMLCGQRDHPGIEPGLKWMQDHADEQKWYEYGRYYATIAMLQAGDSYYHTYYPPVRDKLLKTQQRDGSWNKSGCGIQMNILILGAPYRFIPIYQR